MVRSWPAGGSGRFARSGLFPGRGRPLIQPQTLTLDSPWPLVSLLPIAAISWSGQVLLKAVFACTFTRQLDGCGCPAVTDGLDGF